MVPRAPLAPCPGGVRWGSRVPSLPRLTTLMSATRVPPSHFVALHQGARAAPVSATPTTANRSIVRPHSASAGARVGREGCERLGAVIRQVLAQAPSRERSKRR